MRSLAWGTLGPLSLATACGAAVPFHPGTPAGSSALGSSCILMPRSIEDDALLGRVLLDVPENGRSLDQVSRPNDCGDKLAPKKEDPFTRTFEDAQELAAGGKARAALGMFGLEEDAQAATHFYYKLDVERQVMRATTPEYVACCKDQGTCGYGFVSALAFGEGQYATAVENSANGTFDIPVAASARAFVKAKILHKRNVYGYVAAFVTVTEGAGAKPINVLGDPIATRIDPTEQDLPEQVRARFELQKIRVVASNRSPAEFAYLFSDGSGEISENEFVRRYEAVTGSMQLSGAKKSRSPVSLYYGVAASVVGAFLISTGAYVGLATPQGTQTFASPPAATSVPACDYSTLQFVPAVGYQLQCSPRINPGLGEGLGITGAALLASGLASFAVYGILGYDGSKGDHLIVKSDADLYVAKYNRALLRTMVKGTETKVQPSGKNEPSSFVIAPVVSPGFTGLVGQF
jgi:hypothetical protein